MAGRKLNKAELERQMALDLKKVVDYSVQRIWNENRRFIQEVVYNTKTQSPLIVNNYYDPLKMSYRRTDEFRLKAWDTEVTSNIETNGAIAHGKMTYNGTNLTSYRDEDGALGHHLGWYDEPSRMYLAEIIYEGLAGDFTGKYKYARQNPSFKGEDWTKKRNAWKALVSWLGRDNLLKIFEDGMKSVGMEYHKHNVALLKKIV